LTVTPSASNVRCLTRLPGDTVENAADLCS
jgi:hypothetical protein